MLFTIYIFNSIIFSLFLVFIYRCYKSNKGVTKIKQDELTKLSLIAKNTSKAVFITNSSQEIVWINHAFTTITGYELEESIGKKPFDLLSGEQTDIETLSFLKSEMDLNNSFISTIIFHKKDGSIYWSRISGQSIIDESGIIQQYFGIQEDITNQQFAKKELEDSEKRYRALFHSNPQPMVIYDKISLKFIEVNESAVKKYGITSDEFKNLSIVDLFVDREKDNFFKNDIVNNQTNYDISINSEIKHDSYIHLTKQGQTIHVDLVRNELNLSGKEVVLLIINDVTNKLKIENELRKSNERFSIASRAVRDVIWEWDIQNNQLYWGNGIIENFGYSSSMEFPTTSNFLTYIHPEDIKILLSEYKSIFRDKTKFYWNSEFRFRKSNGSYSYVLDRAFIIRSNQGEPLKMIGAIHDISDQKNYEIEKEKLISRTQEFERKRFSMELHDGLAQQLVVLNLYLSQLNEEGVNNSSLLNSCFEIVKASLDQTRALCYNLTPPALENGLLDALTSLFDRFNRLENIYIKFLCDKAISNLDFESIDTYNLFRIIQEFINNSIKHSNASVIRCEIKRIKNNMVIVLADNGDGFVMEEIQNGLGLDNIYQRAKIANLNCNFKSIENKGTRLELKAK